MYSTYRKVQVLSDSTIVAVGVYESQANKILLIVKYNIKGNIIWNKTHYSGEYNGSDSSNAEGYDVCETDDGNLFVIGYVTPKA